MNDLTQKLLDDVERLRRCLSRSLLIVGVGKTTGFAAPLHLRDERDRRDSVLQLGVRQLWKAGPQHRGPRLVCDEGGPAAAVPLQGVRADAQHEHGDSVQRSLLQSKG